MFRSVDFADWFMRLHAKTVLKINWSVKTPWHEYMEVARSRLWAPDSAPSTIFTPGGSLATNPYLISGPSPSTVTQDEPFDEIMRPNKSDGPDSHSCPCLLVWNSVKDYWERLYGSVVDRNVRVSELKVVPLFSWSEVFRGLCSVFIFTGMPFGSDASDLLRSVMHLSM